MLKLPTRFLSLLAYLHDAIAIALAWWIAFLFRFNFNIPHKYISYFTVSLPVIFILHSLCFYSFGLYRGLWRFASLPDLKRIVRAIAFGALLTVTFALLVNSEIIVPRSVLFIHPMLLVIIMGGSRFVYRAWKERRMFNNVVVQGKPVIVIGVEDSSLNLIKELSKSLEWRVVAMIDPNQKLVGREIMHTKVEGGLQDISRIAERYGCKHCMIAMPGDSHEKRRVAVEAAGQVEGMEVLILPAMSDLISGRVSLSQIRKIDVEDLLGRDPVKLDGAGLHDLIEGQAVMVSGAGGSIGSELCRQVARYQPDTLVCFDLSEFALYGIEQEFATAFPEINIIYVVGDVKSEKRLKALMRQFKPTVVFHAAAYKHVPLMEKNNVSEALANNVLGTYTVAKAAKEAKVEKFVLVSTDKAVNPTNVMGASKRLAEMVCQGLQEPQGTRFVVVRFGNVLGSSGSVIPKFREQIAKGGPITVTHPEITRYFMSIPEAAQLVMQAGLMGSGGEIFVLDMGESVRITDLARDMIKLSGLHEDEIEIVYTGLRPGEKLYEELLADDERTLPTPHEKLRIAVARSADKNWVKALLKWIEHTVNTDELVIKQELKMWVEEYKQEEAKTSGDSYTAAPPSSTIH